MPRILVISAALLLVALPSSADVRTFGNVEGEAESVAIAALIADPDAWVDRAVKVHGVVSAVCPKAGCWMELRDADDARIRIKVDDGVIVFPTDAKGLEATALGTVKIHSMDRETYTGWMRHLAEEKGEAFDPESVGDGPYRIVQIRGDGAAVGAAD